MLTLLETREIDRDELTELRELSAQREAGGRGAPGKGAAAIDGERTERLASKGQGEGGGRPG
jgi:hypothetical protein